MLTVTGSNCYTSMTYNLIQPTGLPLVIMDQAWFLNQFKQIMDADSEKGPRRSFYLFKEK